MCALMGCADGPSRGVRQSLCLPGLEANATVGLHSERLHECTVSREKGSPSAAVEHKPRHGDLSCVVSTQKWQQPEQKTTVFTAIHAILYSMRTSVTHLLKRRNVYANRRSAITFRVLLIPPREVQVVV